jgi:glycosyltransferase involved in cell wall biosynthesis
VYEGFGLPVLEAMGRGIPVVASTTSALPEVTGDAALGVNPRSVREIAAAIASLVGDVALAERLAAAGRLQGRALLMGPDRQDDARGLRAGPRPGVSAAQLPYS